jgi:hypothetical protein
MSSMTMADNEQGLTNLRETCNPMIFATHSKAHQTAE